MRDADVADVPARPRGADGLHHRLVRADRLDHRVCAEAVRDFLDPRHALVPSFFDDVSRAELEGEPLSWLVAAHRDDSLRAEVLCGQHREQADRAITDDESRGLFEEVALGDQFVEFPTLPTYEHLD